MFGPTDEDYLREAKDVARRTTDDPTLQKYIEGEVFRIKKMSDKLDRLYFNFWVVVFLIFILPLFFGRASANNHAPYGTTWQIKCEQRGTGQEAQCWMVEIPNQPVPGIDVPFEEKK